MATYSELRIFFYAEIGVGTTMSFKAGGKTYNFMWVSYRASANQIEVGPPTYITGERPAMNFEAAFNADHMALDEWEVVRSALVVTIKAKSPSVLFSDFSASVGTDKISPSIANYAGPSYTLTSVIFSAATTNPQGTHYKVNITTSLITKTVTGTISISGNTLNPFSFEMPRGVGFELLLAEAGGRTLEVNYSDEDVPEVIVELPPPPVETSAVRYRIGVGYMNDDIAKPDTIIKLPAFTFDREDITFDTTIRTFDEIPV